MLHDKRYGNYAADSAAKFHPLKNYAADSTACFHSGGAAWGRSAQAPPELKKNEKNKTNANGNANAWSHLKVR